MDSVRAADLLINMLGSQARSHSEDISGGTYSFKSSFFLSKEEVTPIFFGKAASSKSQLISGFETLSAKLIHLEDQKLHERNFYFSFVFAN